MVEISFVLVKNILCTFVLNKKDRKNCKGEKMENYFIIHGSFSSPYSNWIGWLHDFLETDGKQSYVPHFPIGVGYQNYENWSRILKNYLDIGLINENTTIVGHSIAPVFISKFLVENNVKVKNLIFVCGFNNYFGINEEYDTVNSSMYFDNLEDIKKHANEIVCFYSNNDPYVKYEAEKDFADKVSTQQILIPNAGHINAESGYDTFEDIVIYF